MHQVDLARLSLARTRVVCIKRISRALTLVAPVPTVVILEFSYQKLIYSNGSGY